MVPPLLFEQTGFAGPTERLSEWRASHAVEIPCSRFHRLVGRVAHRFAWLLAELGRAHFEAESVIGFPPARITAFPDKSRPAGAGTPRAVTHRETRTQ